MKNLTGEELEKRAKEICGEKCCGMTVAVLHVIAEVMNGGKEPKKKAAKE